MKFVSILIGNKNDYEIMSEAGKILEKFGVAYELLIVSAHRSPDRMHTYVKEAEKKGAKIFITSDAMVVHMAGVVASLSTRAVIGVGIKKDMQEEMNALFPSVQMPAGIPVATVGLGKNGAINSAYLAMQMLAIEDEELSVKLQEDRILKAKKTQSDSVEVEKRL